MNDFIKPETEHVCREYYFNLHESTNYFQKEITAALRRHRLKKENEFDFSGTKVSLEQVKSATKLFVEPCQAPHFEMNLFEKEKAAIRKAIDDLEDFLRKLQKILKGVKIPKRPSEVDEWMKK